MRKIVSLFTVLLFATLGFAQTPREFNYQGVARNAQGQALANQPIKVKANLLRESPDGTMTTFRTETRSLTTNALGLFSFKINDGTASLTTGNFQDGQWLNPDYYQHLKIELDVNNTGTWTDMGTQKISSVPYSLFAGSSWYAKELEVPVVAFNATSTAPQTISDGLTAKLTFETAASGSSNYSTSTHEFVASNSGMHHFDAFVYFNAVTSGVTGEVQLILYVNNTPKQTFRFPIQSDGEYKKVAQFNTNIRLAENDKVSLYMKNATSQGLVIGIESTYFNGNNIR